MKFKALKLLAVLLEWIGVLGILFTLLVYILMPERPEFLQIITNLPPLIMYSIVSLKLIGCVVSMYLASAINNYVDEHGGNRESIK